MGISSNEQVKVINGRTSMSVYESGKFIDYERFEQNVKIVRDRYFFHSDTGLFIHHRLVQSAIDWDAL